MVPGSLLRRALWLPAVGAGLAATATRYYLTHPQRIIADPPADLAQNGQHIYLRGSDGARLHAFWIPTAARAAERHAERTVIHLHGYNASGGLLLSRVPPFKRGPFHLPDGTGPQPLFAWPLVRAGLARGYNFLLVDLRGHGRSAGPWDTTGLHAISDLMGWTRWLRSERGQLWAGLWGNSFGASVGLALAAKSSGGGLDAMVLDSPAITADGLYSGVIRKPAYWLIHPTLYQLSNKSLLKQLEIARVWMPILLIHGKEDRHVPAWQSQRAYQLIRPAEAPERVQLWLVPGADHLRALEVAEQEYIEKALNWFDRWFGNDQV
ncbi:MAG: alpha/beta hydrolase [Anaerolineae bacterium]